MNESAPLPTGNEAAPTAIPRDDYTNWDPALMRDFSPSEALVAVFGQEDFHTHLMPAEQVVMREQLALFQKELKW